MITILSQDRLKIIHCNAVNIAQFGHFERVIFGTTGGESEYILGRYKPERAEEIIMEIYNRIADDGKQYIMPKV